MARLGSVPATLGARVPSSASAVPAAKVASRHSALVRITHWIITLCFFALLVSGTEIMISHPRFYWGETGNVLTKPLFKLPIPSSRSLVPTGYGYVLPDQNGWSRYLHFQAAWIAVLTGLLYLIYGVFSGHFRQNLFPAGPIFRGARCRAISRTICASAGRARQRPGRITCSSGSATCCNLRSVPVSHLDGPGDVPGFRFRVSGRRHGARRPAICAHAAFLRLHRSRTLPVRPCGDGMRRRIQKPHARHDHRPRRRAEGAPMSNLSRRKLITSRNRRHRGRHPAWASPRTSRKSTA